MNRVRRRLATLSAGEVAWRVRARLRIEADRLTAAARRPRWRRAAIGDVLARDVVDRELRVLIATEEWGGVQRRLEDGLRARPPRFVLDSGRRALLRQRVLDRCPDAPAAAAIHADAMLAGSYDLLGYDGIVWPQIDGAPDWHQDPVNGGTAPRRFWAAVPYLDSRYGDHKVIWELNRHQHWLALGRAAWLTGDPRYANAIVHQLRSWIASNPPLTGINWASMLEVGFRTIAWTWSMHMLLGLPDEERRPLGRSAWLVDMLVGLDRQLAHVANNLSHYFSPNTHLTGEALALYVVGSALPELARSAEFAAAGRQVLLAELDRQVLADGGHVERSTHYHRYTLDFYLLALETAILTGDERAAAQFRAACHRLATFLRALTDDEGRVPLIGDDDGGRLWPVVRCEPFDVRATLSLAAALLRRPELAPWPAPEEVSWVTASDLDAAEREAAASRPRAGRDGVHVFADTGIAVARDDGGGQLVMDVGPHGYLNGGHAHADALSVTLTADGRPILVDCGTGSYTTDRDRRDRLRSSVSHNTVTVDARSSSVPAGPFHWLTRADAHLHGSRGNSALAWIEGWHDGYAPLRHRRTVVSAAGAGWLVVDELLGEPHAAAAHVAESHWHFDAGWSLDGRAANRIRASDEDGRVAWLAHDGGVATIVDTERWPVYGRRRLAPTVRISHEARGPWASVAWVGIGPTPPTLERLIIECDSGGTAVAARLRRAWSSWTTVLRPGEPVSRDLRSCASADYHTNARLLHYGLADSAWTVLALIDASHALALHDGLVSAASETLIQDLHVALDGERLFLHAARPPARLRLEGQRLAAVRTLVLNGRSLTRSNPRTELLEVSGADWAEAHVDGTEPIESSAPWLRDHSPIEV